MKISGGNILPYLTNNIIIEDDKKLLCEGVSAIGGYECDCVVLKLKNYSLKIEGQSLLVKEFSQRFTEVSGQLFSITFVYE